MLLMMLGCSGGGLLTLSDFELTWREKDAALTITRFGRTLVDLQSLELGDGSAAVGFVSGQTTVEDATVDWKTVSRLKVLSRKDTGSFVADLRDEDGASLGLLQIFATGPQQLELIIDSTIETNRARITLACTGQDTFLGAGGHAVNVDHGGQSFSLMASESAADPRYTTSHPDPFLLRPDEPAGYQLNTIARVEVDLCQSDPDRWSMTTWEGDLSMTLLAGLEPLEIVGLRTNALGGASLPPDWAFAPWIHARNGQDRVLEVAQTLRAAGVSSSVIWTDDWQGSERTDQGVHPLPAWALDTELYPDSAALDDALEAAGFKWLGRFSPLVSPASAAWEEAAPLTITDPDSGAPYTVSTTTLAETSLLDLTHPDAWEWAQEKMQSALEVGLDGWMVDHGEWLPPAAQLYDGDALDDHNAWPLLWSALNAEVINGADATFFAQSGWSGSAALAPISRAGSPHTSFEAEAGLPTVMATGLGLSMSGVAFYGPDIAGADSSGSPADKELWWRWCSLGAFSPIMRTHHGGDVDASWQPDSDAETLEHYAAYAAEHTRLFPYLRGLADVAASTGFPLIRHPAMHFEDAEWSAADAWLLGEAMYVAPVLTRGETSRSVALPADVGWYDWWTGAPASAGTFSAELDEIPVFVAAGSLIPLLTTAPDTLADATDAGLRTWADADGARKLRVFGSGGQFTEADGTTYSASGTAAAADTATETLTEGTVEVGGVTVQIAGDVERTYTVTVHP